MTYETDEVQVLALVFQKHYQVEVIIKPTYKYQYDIIFYIVRVMS